MNIHNCVFTNCLQKTSDLKSLEAEASAHVSEQPQTTRQCFRSTVPTFDSSGRSRDLHCVLLSLFGWENLWLVVFVILGRQCSLQTVCRCLRPNLHNPNLESWEGNGGGKVYGGKRERSQTEFSANGVVVDTFAQQEKGHWFNSLCRHRVWRKGNPIKSITLPLKAKTFWCSYSTVIISANLKVGGSPMHPLVCEST